MSESMHIPNPVILLDFKHFISKKEKKKNVIKNRNYSNILKMFTLGKKTRKIEIGSDRRDR